MSILSQMVLIEKHGLRVDFVLNAVFVEAVAVAGCDRIQELFSQIFKGDDLAL